MTRSTFPIEPRSPCLQVCGPAPSIPYRRARSNQATIKAQTLSKSLACPWRVLWSRLKSWAAFTDRLCTTRCFLNRPKIGSPIRVAGRLYPVSCHTTPTLSTKSPLDTHSDLTQRWFRIRLCRRCLRRVPLQWRGHWSRLT